MRKLVEEDASPPPLVTPVVTGIARILIECLVKISAQLDTEHVSDWSLIMHEIIYFTIIN